MCTTACSAFKPFDRNNIAPGERVLGPGFSLAVPTQTYWFASDYGNGSKLRLVQLNHLDSFIIEATLSRGPITGMFISANEHLATFKRHIARRLPSTTFDPASRQAWADEQYGAMCLRYAGQGLDDAGINALHPKTITAQGLVCPHPHAANLLVRIELRRRFEARAAEVDLTALAETLFASLDYHHL